MLGRLLGRGGPDRAQVLAEHLGMFFAPAEVTGVGSRPGEWDFLEVPPTPQRPWRAVCTVGAGSDAEFLIGMPADMLVTEERGFPAWPVQVLIDLAADSHQIDVGPGHTNGPRRPARAARLAGRTRGSAAPGAGSDPLRCTSARGVALDPSVTPSAAVGACACQAGPARNGSDPGATQRV